VQAEILRICIRFYCDIKLSNKTLVPWLVRTTFSTVLYNTNICMKLFHMVSPMFGTNMQSIEATHGLRSVMASGPSHSRV
jgi:hypothetical protein